jgi:hypothetical protein
LITNGPVPGAEVTRGSRAGGRRGVLRLVLPVVVIGVAVVDGRPRWRRGQVRPALVEQGDALLDALQRLGYVALEALEDADRVFVRAGPDALGVIVRLGDDPPALELGGLGQAALVDEERRLLLGLGDDALGLFLRLLDDPLALGIDAFGRADLLGDGDAQLIDQAERGVLVDDDVGRQRQLLPVRDERLETLDEEDDVDGRGPPARASGLWHAGSWLSVRRVPP